MSAVRMGCCMRFIDATGQARGIILETIVKSTSHSDLSLEPEPTLIIFLRHFHAHYSLFSDP